MHQDSATNAPFWGCLWITRTLCTPYPQPSVYNSSSRGFPYGVVLVSMVGHGSPWTVWFLYNIGGTNTLALHQPYNPTISLKNGCNLGGDVLGVLFETEQTRDVSN